MAPRQVWLFKLGCWVAFVTAGVHLTGHVVGPTAPANETERQLTELATTYKFLMPGGWERSLMDFVNGFSLTFSLFLATIGGLGLMVVKRGQGDPVLLMATARTLAVSSLVLLVINLVYFFLIPAAFILVMALCFLLASVSPPAPAPEP
jgi:hypothetical protein